VSTRRAEEEAAATLARLGLDAEALRAGRVDVVRVAPLMAGSDAAALAAALGELPSPAVAELLAALEPHARDRAARKAIRRTLYRLAQRGVPRPPPPPTAPPPARAAEPVVEGLVSAVDGRGDRLVWLLRALPTGGSLLVTAQLNEPEGLRDVHAAELGRKALRALRERLEREAGLRLVPAEWRTLDALLVEAHERAGGGERERDYLRVRPRLTGEPPAAASEPVSARVAPAGAEESAALVAGSAALLGEREFETWWPTPEAAAPFAGEIAAARESPLVVSRLAQEDRLREILRRTARALFPPAVLARRLAGTAYVLAETARPAAARQALAVAGALAARPEDAADIPFVAALVERALAGLLARDSEEQRGALVVTPGQFLRDRASSRPGRTRG